LLINISKQYDKDKVKIGVLKQMIDYLQNFVYIILD